MEITSTVIAEGPVSAVVEAATSVAVSLIAVETPVIIIAEVASPEIVTVSKVPASEVVVPEAPVVAEAMESRAAEPVTIVEVFKMMEAKAAVHIKRPVVDGMRVIEVVPGARANKDAVGEPLRAVVAIRRAAKRIRGIEPVFAHRGCIVNAVSRPYLYAD